MKLTIEYVKARFAGFNTLYFGGKLPEPVFKIMNSRTRLGMFVCRKERKGFFLTRRVVENVIKLSSYYDATERDYDNILLHEMIHYYISYSGRRDNSMHGRLFTAEMERLNACGWQITVSVNTRQWSVAERNKVSRYCVLALKTTNGHSFLSVVNPAYRNRIDRMAKASPQVAAHGWYESTDDFFASFPRVRSLRCRRVKASEYNRMMLVMRPQKVDGNE
ncbi:MAG: SprT-like domain-containing protein [Prevotella sp.]